jgi:hypothetical protein
MKRTNIFDEITNSDDVSEEALCAIHEMLERLVHEFEVSAFYRIKNSLKETKESNRTSCKSNSQKEHEAPF